MDNVKFSSFNPLIEGTSGEFKRDPDYMYINFFGIKTCLHETVTTDDVDYALYKDMNRDFEEFKDSFVDYAYFLSSMRKMNVTFEVSPHHSQDVFYEVLFPIYEGFLNTLKKSAKERNYNESEEDDNSEE